MCVCVCRGSEPQIRSLVIPFEDDEDVWLKYAAMCRLHVTSSGTREVQAAARFLVVFILFYRCLV